MDHATGPGYGYAVSGSSVSRLVSAGAAAHTARAASDASVSSGVVATARVHTFQVFVISGP